jgi:hypothetical protein
MSTLLLPGVFLPLASLATTAKAVSGLANGASKAVILRGFAISDNLGDVTAKAYSQVRTSNLASVCDKVMCAEHSLDTLAHTHACLGGSCIHDWNGCRNRVDVAVRAVCIAAGLHVYLVHNAFGNQHLLWLQRHVQCTAVDTQPGARCILGRCRLTTHACCTTRATPHAKHCTGGSQRAHCAPLGLARPHCHRCSAVYGGWLAGTPTRATGIVPSTAVHSQPVCRYPQHNFDASRANTNNNSSSSSSSETDVSRIVVVSDGTHASKIQNTRHRSWAAARR